MSKGSAARPFAVDRDTFANNFDAIFKKRTPEQQAKDELGPFVQEALSAPAYGLDDGKPKAK